MVLTIEQQQYSGQYASPHSYYRIQGWKSALNWVLQEHATPERMKLCKECPGLEICMKEMDELFTENREEIMKNIKDTLQGKGTILRSKADIQQFLEDL